MQSEERKLPDWMEEMGRANAPFNSENTPLLRLVLAVQRTNRSFDGLHFSTEAVYKRMVTIDQAPRHDTVLSADVLQSLASDSYRWPMHTAHRELKHSLEAIDRAFSDIRNVFRGDLKAKYYERVARHRAQALELVELFSNIPADDATQPFMIRQRSMANLYHEFCERIDLLTPVRRSFKPGELPGDFYESLKEADADLYRMRSSIARWRDNPSQKLGKKMADICARTRQIRLTISRLSQDAAFECQELGMRFCNRGGRVVIERWTAPTHY